MFLSITTGTRWNRGETQSGGTVFISLGWTVRRGAWGMDRTCAVSFLSQRAPQTPLTEFLAADDHPGTGELIAIIRGRDGGRKMYGPAEELPPAYAGFRIVIYRDRVQANGSWNKLAVVATSRAQSSGLDKGRRPVSCPAVGLPLGCPL